MAREIEVIISDDGAVSIEALGFEGKACEDATKELEKVLGETTESKKKPEWYKQSKQVLSQR
jgi:hypothetical protein